MKKFRKEYKIASSSIFYRIFVFFVDFSSFLCRHINFFWFVDFRHKQSTVLCNLLNLLLLFIDFRIRNSLVIYQKIVSFFDEFDHQRSIWFFIAFLLSFQCRITFNWYRIYLYTIWTMRHKSRREYFATEMLWTKSVDMSFFSQNS